jgi:chromosome segregation ATPase
METKSFKTVPFGGFDKEEVIQYIQQIAQEFQEAQENLRRENRDLRAANKVLQNKLDAGGQQRDSQSQKDLKSQRDAAAKLTAQVAERDAQVTSLTAQVADLTAQVTSFTAQTAERDSQVTSLTAQLAERDSRIAALSVQMGERDPQKVAALTAQVAERDAQMANLSAQLAERDSRIAKLTAQMTDLEPLAQSYREIRTQVGDIECQARKRAAELENATVFRVNAMLGSVQRQYQDISNLFAATAVQLTSELRKIEVGLTQLPLAMDQTGKDLAQLADNLLDTKKLS